MPRARRLFRAPGYHLCPLDPSADGPPGLRLKRLKQSESGGRSNAAAKLIDKWIWRPRLLAHVVLAKYLEHLPLHPVQQELTHFGVENTRKRLAGRVKATTMAYESLYLLARDNLMAGRYLQIDDIPVQVIDPEIEGRAATG